MVVKGLTLLESLRVALISVVAILIMSAKFATLGLLKINVFWKKYFDVMISAHNVTNKNLSSNTNYIVDMVM